jgi:glycosyltransferase involved in cell wall biosynthesis
MRNGAGKRVLIIQGQIKQYRVPFFDKLHAALEEDGITLRVAYSDPALREREKRDNCDLSSGYGVKVKGHWGFGSRVIWQPLLREIAAADFVIVEHANKYIMNHFLLPCSALGIKKVAFWGHGRNRQSTHGGPSEWLKRRTLNRVNWWFAYTAGTVDYLVRSGVPPYKITNVQNAVDTTGFRNHLSSVSEFELAAARKGLGLAEDSKVGLFCGGVTREKMPEFLVESVVKIKDQLPEFEFLALGSGPEKACFERAAGRYPWFHYIGPEFGKEKALHFRLADVFLMPGLVGLAILDAFAAGVPVITTSVPIHSPEIEYLEEGRSGLTTQPDTEAYSQAVVSILRNAQLLEALRQGASTCAEKYSIERMVANFQCGVIRALGLGPSECGHG